MSFLNDLVWTLQFFMGWLAGILTIFVPALGWALLMEWRHRNDTPTPRPDSTRKRATRRRSPAPDADGGTGEPDDDFFHRYLSAGGVDWLAGR